MPSYCWSLAILPTGTIMTDRYSIQSKPSLGNQDWIEFQQKFIKLSLKQDVATNKLQSIITAITAHCIGIPHLSFH